MESQLATANNPWLAIMGIMALMAVAGVVLAISGFIKLRRAKPKIRKLLDVGAATLVLLCGVCVWASVTIKTEQVTVIDASCHVSSTFALIFPGTVKVMKADGRVATLIFPINGYEESRMNVLNEQGEAIDAWYMSYFCNPDQSFSEYVKDIYDPVQPIQVTTNHFGRIKFWQFTN